MTLRTIPHLVAIVALFLVGLVAEPAAAQSFDDDDIDDLPISGAARWIDVGIDDYIQQITFSPQLDTLLVVTNAKRDAFVIDLNSGSVVSEHRAIGEFSDAAVTPDGRYFFLADTGEWVQRYDVVRNTWALLASAGPVDRIEAVSATRVLTTQDDRWEVPLQLQSFALGAGAMAVLSEVNGGDGGDVVFHAASGRVYRANYLEDFKIDSLLLDGDVLSPIASIGFQDDEFFPGRAELVLSPDGSRLFLANHEYDTADLSRVQVHTRGVAGATDGWLVFGDGALQRLSDGIVVNGPQQWSPSTVHVAPMTGEFFVGQPEFGTILHCQALADSIGCPLARPPADLCDGAVVTIDMNTNGGNGVGTAADDVILGTPGDDFINGGGGDDLICAGDGDDLVWGGKGDDTIFGQGGADVVIGGPENDAVVGGDGDDVVHGSTGDDHLAGGDGADRIFGYAGDDTISGDAGDDRLHGNFGNDNLFGGDGDDRIFGYGDSDSLYGNAGNDIMSGNFGDDSLFGGDGDDVMYGADGNDGLDGGAGNDRLFGNSLNDLILGGDGNDAMDGGIGTDTCDGQGDVDTATRCETIIGVP